MLTLRNNTSKPYGRLTDEKEHLTDKKRSGQLQSKLLIQHCFNLASTFLVY